MSKYKQEYNSLDLKDKWLVIKVVNGNQKSVEAVVKSWRRQPSIEGCEGVLVHCHNEEFSAWSDKDLENIGLMRIKRES